MFFENVMKKGIPRITSLSQVIFCRPSFFPIALFERSGRSEELREVVAGLEAAPHLREKESAQEVV